MNNTQGLPLEVRLSAFIDGEVNEAEKHELEALIASNEEARKLYDLLRAGNDFGNKAFEDQLHDPVPLALVRRIKQGPGVNPKAERVTEVPVRLAQSSVWPKAMAASVALFVVGGALGYMIGHQPAGFATTEIASARTWLDDVADYHRIYTRAGERLVEVPASEGNTEIATWLASSVGVDFKVPDLAAQGLTFEGARLLVAAGKPVAQLMYKDASGAVIAICFLKSASTGQTTAFSNARRGAVDLVSWNKGDAAFVVVGPADNKELKAVAETVSTSI
ncbi:anti-sigma factor family protein [Pararhizobium sp.]|uniref:anti-sigma factor family protein n=1 Tax=Pararhizobium sp. TaxID=1977563 RepID=UPI00271D869C|nr:anti-sigma factor [Pararhizobium sp.]MDO9414838.1 anti-sigma factor [Pararhizobium sp.]